MTAINQTADLLQRALDQHTRPHEVECPELGETWTLYRPKAAEIIALRAETSRIAKLFGSDTAAAVKADNVFLGKILKACLPESIKDQHTDEELAVIVLDRGGTKKSFGKELYALAGLKEVLTLGEEENPTSSPESSELPSESSDDLEETSS